MARDVEELFHETWLGEAEPLQGLTFSVPVLCDGGVMNRLSSADAEAFAALAPADDEGVARLVGLIELLTDFLGFAEAEIVAKDALPEELVLRIAEEGTELRPDAAIGWGGRRPKGIDDPTARGEETPASRAGRELQMLLWELPRGMDPDAAESETNEWHYPPVAKLERLLRETRVPMGLLSNGDVVRLLYCPTGHATGWISFPVEFMAEASGRDMLSAFRELLHADRVLGSTADVPTTVELLEQSRDRQADVTTRLGDQLLDGLQILLQGFESAARRDGDDVLREAMRQEGNHVYEGLLTVMLRLVFALAAEDRGLVPSEHPIYAAHLSVGGLYDELQADQDVYADTMEHRFGAWSRLVMLFRTLYFGVELPGGAEREALSMPPHHGRLFNPENYPFLEGGTPAGGVAVSPEARAKARIPSISDGVVLRVLRRLLYLDAQRLSYSALEEEQLGSVYEGLMGYTIERRDTASVCLRPSRVWVSPEELLEQPKATRVMWLKNAGVVDAAAKRLADGVEQAAKEAGDDGEALHEAVMTVLRKESIARRGKRGERRGEDGKEAEVAAGRLVIQPGEERRRTSTHYTPRSLSGPIVARTLEPLLAAMRAKAKQEDPTLEDPQPSSDALLSLKVCDPAMGSGAFLVEACRFLAKQVEAAWVREGKLAQMVREAEEDDVVKRDPLRLAQRMVAQLCLYGVDKNPFAVELGKLSLWLLTLSRGQTFAFLDHCLKAGDSLVGLSKGQILAMDWAVEEAAGEGKDGATGKEGKAAKGKGKGKRGDDQTLDLFAEQTRRAFEKAMLARKKLGDLARTGDRGGTEKEQHALHQEAEAALERLRDVADVILSAFFWPYEEEGKLTPEFLFEGEKPSDKDRQACLVRVRDDLQVWLAMAEEPPMPVGLEQRRVLVRECIRPLHWHLEFPEVFDEGRMDPLATGIGGKVWMDAVVGNPPFSWKNGIVAANGGVYLDWLTEAYIPSHGNADLSAYFFRRSNYLLGSHGTQGLIATNTIGQGDTRITGLQPIVVAGGQIYDAVRDMEWPVKGANVSVSIVHIAVGIADRLSLERRLDGKVVRVINSQLRPKPERTDPVALKVNAKKCFVGHYVLGQGFVLTPEGRGELVAKDVRNSERIFSYLGGEELNSNSTLRHHRYVINFGDMSLESAEQWPDLIAILREKVKPEREKLKDNADGRRRKKNWWLYGRSAPSLDAAIASLARCIATSLTAKHRVFDFVPTNMTLDQTLIVIASDSLAQFGVLQSRIHIMWSLAEGATFRSDPRYSVSRCFETFPFPPAAPLAPGAPLEAIAAQLSETRAAYMLATNQGLTKTYNALKDPTVSTPEILELRRLHEALDRAVLDAYDQPSITVPPYCGATPAQLEQFEDEVLDFLFARNELLAKQEARAAKRAQS